MEQRQGRNRLVIIAILGLGVIALAGGMLALAPRPRAGDNGASPSAVALVSPRPTVAPGSSASGALTPPTPAPSADPSSSVAPSPSATVAPSSTPKAGSRPTRVVVADLGIDLAIVKAPSGYPYCNVAMYFPTLGRPGENRATYVFAHARDGMFGPIYELSMVKQTPDTMLGMLVEVYTADDQVHLYKITRVRRHVLTMDAAVATRSDRLFLQTSEGPHGTPGKTQVIAEPVSVSPVDHASAHPPVHRVVCG